MRKFVGLYTPIPGTKYSLSYICSAAEKIVSAAKDADDDTISTKTLLELCSGLEMLQMIFEEDEDFAGKTAAHLCESFTTHMIHVPNEEDE